MALAQFVVLALVFNKGMPHRSPLWTNKWLVLTLVVQVGAGLNEGTGTAGRCDPQGHTSWCNPPSGISSAGTGPVACHARGSCCACCCLQRPSLGLPRPADLSDFALPLVPRACRPRSCCTRCSPTTCSTRTCSSWWTGRTSTASWTWPSGGALSYSHLHPDPGTNSHPPTNALPHVRLRQVLSALLPNALRTTPHTSAPCLLTS